MVCQTLEVMQPKVNRLKAMTNRSPLDEKEYERLSLFQERLFEMHRYMLRDGVDFIAGTDAGWNECPFGMMWEGLKLLADCGMNNRQLLYSATGKSAAWLGISDRTGIIFPCEADVPGRTVSCTRTRKTESEGKYSFFRQWSG